jgi:hypothetical protein
MIKRKGSISMGTAALITGLTLFLPSAPYAEFYVFNKLIIYNDSFRTSQNILNNPKLFLSGIFAMLFTYIIDVVLSWTMYIFLKRVNTMLTLLAAWFRLVYTGLAVVALFNFIYVFKLLNMPGFSEPFKSEQILLLINARQFSMNLAYIFFGIYQVLLGILIYKASYIPKVIGVMMMLAGVAWIIINIQPYLLKNYDLDWMMFFSVGELVFVIWLLVKGSRINEYQIAV